MAYGRRSVQIEAESSQSRTAVLYARVSTKEQEEEGYSLDAQLRLVRRYAADRGFEVLAEFVEAETAKQAGRHEFQRLLTFVRKHSVGAVLCEKIDRLYRNLPDRVKVGELDTELHFVKENTILSKHSKSHEKFVHDIKLVVAKNYIDNLSEETRKGMREKAEQGLWPSVAPIGYFNIVSGSRRLISVNGEDAPKIATIYRTYAEGNTSIAQARGLADIIGLRSRNGKKLATSAVAALLSNPIYCGLVQWNGQTYQGSHEPIVSRELWQQVQDLMHGRFRNKTGFGVLDFTYKGLFTCGHCGCALTAELKKGRYIYYHCTGRRGKCPGQRCISEADLTEQVAGHLERLYIEPEIIEMLRGALLAGFKDEQHYHEEQCQEAQKKVKELDARLETLYVDKISGQISLSTYERLRTSWEAELDMARDRLSSLEGARALSADLAINLLELGSNCHSRFKQGNPKQKRDLLKTLCSNREVKDGFVQLSFAEPFNSMLETVGSGVDLREMQNWLPAKDSNLD